MHTGTPAGSPYLENDHTFLQSVPFFAKVSFGTIVWPTVDGKVRFVILTNFESERALYAKSYGDQAYLLDFPWTFYSYFERELPIENSFALNTPL